MDQPIAPFAVALAEANPEASLQQVNNMVAFTVWRPARRTLGSVLAHGPSDACVCPARSDFLGPPIRPSYTADP